MLAGRSSAGRHVLSGFELLSADGWCQWSKQTRCLRLSLSVCFNFNVARCHSVPQRLVLLLWVKLLRCPWMPRHRRCAHTAWWSVKLLLLKTFQLVMLRRTNIQTLWVFRNMNSDKGTHHCFYNQVLLFVFIGCFTMNTLFLCSLNISIKNCDQRIAFFFFTMMLIYHPDSGWVSWSSCWIRASDCVNIQGNDAIHARWACLSPATCRDIVSPTTGHVLESRCEDWDYSHVCSLLLINERHVGLKWNYRSRV